MSRYSEEDVRAKHIDPALQKAGWSESLIRREVAFTDGRIIIRGKTVTRGKKKRADYILYAKPNIPIALIEAKDNNHTPGDGMQQGLDYAESLDIPFVYSTNGEQFIEHNRLGGDTIEREIGMDEFPTLDELKRRFIDAKDFNEEQKDVFFQDYFQDGSGKSPRYYQQNAINKVVEAVAKGQDRIMLVMATGTGKTYTAFQIIWRLWKSKQKKRILFLVDRTALADQTLSGDFRHFDNAITRVNGPVDKAYEVYVALYQGLMSGEEEEKFKQFSSDFFDLIVVDECHRGAAREDAQWRAVLDYFDSATHLGLTATPKAADDADNFEYFGDPVYTYSLKQGIDDGYLAPYKVIRYRFDNDEWRPPQGFVDKDGNAVPDEIYNENMFDRSIIIEDRNKAVAKCIAEYMRDTDLYQKVIVFCVDIAHAERMRRFLSNELSEQAQESSRYVVKITGDDQIGKLEIENFINPESQYPVIATTSKLLSTGVDTKMVKLVVLDAPMNSMTEFKQTIGRGTRIAEQFGKYYFTIMDFRNVTRLFADPDFDGEPVKAYEGNGDNPLDIKETLEKETVSEDEIIKHNPQEDIILDGTDTEEKPKKIHIKEGVAFDPIQKVVQYIDPKTGKLITTSLVDYSKITITNAYHSIDDFLSRWKETERKDVIINELSEMGIVFDELRAEVGKDLDVFDLILHIAYGKKPLTRSERLKNVQSKDYFEKYEGKAREIIDLLLAKYADQGITAIDDIGDLTVNPFSDYGTPVEIVNEIFGGREQYMEVIKNIETALYSE